MSNKILTPLAGFQGVQGPVVTIVMDGVGLAPDTAGNAVRSAYTPNLDMLLEKYPNVSSRTRHCRWSALR